MRTGVSLSVKREMLGWLVVIAVIAGLSLVCIAGQALYSLGTLAWARGNGVYASPQQAVAGMASRRFCQVETVTVIHTAPNDVDGADPRVWSTSYQVFAHGLAPCGDDRSGSTPQGAIIKSHTFLLLTRDGWVHVPEQRFPFLVGKWMNALGMAGPEPPAQ
jgi:hypothetical protein